MRYLDQIYWFIRTLHIVGKDLIADWSSHQGWFAPGHSAYVNSDKRCKRLVEQGKIVAGDGFYKLPHVKSEYKEHSQALSEHLAEVLKLPYESTIIREKLLPVGLRPDALVLLKDGDKGCCFILEVKVNEPESYFQQKVSAWRSWADARDHLSELFGYKIPSFVMVTNENFDKFIRGL